MNSHIKRILTSVVLLPILCWVILYGSRFSLQVLIFFVSVLGLWEFISLFEGQKGFFLKICAAILSLPMVFNNFLPISLEYLLIFYFWIINLFFLFSFGLGNKISWNRIQLVFLSIIYIPFVLQFFQMFSRQEIVFVIGIAFISDTCAYYAGSWWGNKKLWVMVSPKKTWIGAIGSLTGCLIFTLIFGKLVLHFNWVNLLILGIVLNIGAQLGDLFESALKRYLEVKDSGSLLPGHGGILDRIDSLLFVCPLYLIFVKILNPF